MTFKFTALQTTNKVPVSLIIFKQQLTETASIYLGIVGNQNALDELTIAESSVAEILKVFKNYLDRNNIRLITLLPYNIKTDEQHIVDVFQENEHMLFIQ